jgi:putative oxidoreductase
VTRLANAYPTGLPGAALLLLRSSVAYQLSKTLTRSDVSPVVCLVVAVFVGVPILIGLFTKASATIVCIFAALGFLTHNRVPGCVITLPWLDAAALAMLGSGAYGVDGRLFGRRVIQLAPEPKAKSPQG